MTERVPYTLLRKIDQVETRRYPRMVLATVSSRTDYEAFGILFEYISGNNKSRRRIPMTAPVISATGANERIPMTVPVLSTPGTFSFVLPSGYKAQEAPEPLDTRAVIEEIPERDVAVLVFRGKARETQTKRKAEELLAALRTNNIETKGEPFLMRYNPPFIPGLFRHNEIGVEIKASE